MHGMIPISYLDGLLTTKGASKLLATAGLAPDLAEIDHLSFWRLLRDNISRTRDEQHAIGPQNVPEGSFALLLAAMRLGSDLADGLSRLAGAARIVRPDLGITFTRRRDLVLEFAPPALRDVQSALYVELIVVVIHAASCWMTGSVFRPRQITAAKCKTCGSGSVYALVGAPVRRGGNRVSVRYAAADGRRLLAAEAFDLWPTLVFEAYRQLADVTESHNTLSARVRARLLQGHTTQDVIAKEMKMSAASLRRGLLAEGQGFRDLASDVRRGLASDSLKAGRKVEDIASDLGYSEARSLRRATKRWFNKPPNQLKDDRPN